MRKFFLILIAFTYSLQAQTTAFDTIDVKGFIMTTGAVEGWCLKVHADGRAYWAPCSEGGETVNVRLGIASALTGGSYMNFTTVMAVSTYAIIINAYKTTSPYETVGVTISNRSAAGFLVTPIEDCFIEYLAVDEAMIPGAPFIRAGSGSSGTSGYTVTYDSTFGGTDYTLFVRAYDPNNEGIGVGYTYTLADTGFTITPIDTCKFEYIAMHHDGDTTPIIMNAGLDSSGTTAHLSSFTTAFSTTDFPLFVKAYKTVNDPIPFSYVKAVGSVTTTLTDTGYVKYMGAEW